jgi:hypothetical protein
VAGHTQYTAPSTEFTVFYCVKQVLRAVSDGVVLFRIPKDYMLYVVVVILQGYSKRSIHFQKFILQKITVYGWKGNLSKF